MTSGDLIKEAFVEAGIVLPSENLTAPDGEFGRSKLNRMLSSWANKGTMLYTTLIATYTLTPSQQVYTIGRGTSPAADFVADRPVGPGFGKGILQANILIDAATDYRTPLRVLGEAEWSQISITDIDTSIPWAIYNDGAAPNSNLYLYGIPSEAHSLELFTRAQLTEYSDLVTDVNVPKGYEEAMIMSLAEALCPSYKLQATAELVRAARLARAAIASVNVTPPLISTRDSGIPNRTEGTYFDYMFGRPI